MKRILVVLSFLLLLPTGTSEAAIQEAGYYGQTLQLSRDANGDCQLDASRYNAQTAAGTSPTYATALSDATDIYLLADCAGYLAYWQRFQDARLVIDLTGTLFDPATNHDLRPGYATIMANFYNRAQASKAAWLGHGFTSSNVITAVIHNEAGNSAAGNADINYAVQEWDRYYPQIPTTAGYPMSNASSPLPAVFPWRLDYVATWDYDTFAPLHPANSANKGVPTFYDPANPTSVNTKWGNFLSRLQAHQKVFLLIAGWYGCWQQDNGWARWYMKYVAEGFCNFALQRPEVEMVTVWLWESYPSSPTSIACPGGGTVAYDLEGSGDLDDTGIFPFHDKIFDVAAGTRMSCQ